MTDMNVQKSYEKSFFGKNMTFKNLLTKASSGFELGICGSQEQCPRPLSYVIYKKVDRYKFFHRIFKSPYCDVDS